MNTNSDLDGTINAEANSFMAAQEFHETAGKMTRSCGKIVSFNVRWIIMEKMAVFRRVLKFVWDRLLVCSRRMSVCRYRRLSPRRNCSSFSTSREVMGSGCGAGNRDDTSTTPSSCGYESDSDLVSLKISILGDCQIGKTSFAIKYVGHEQEQKSLQMNGLNLMDKTIEIGGGVKIACRIWDVAGDRKSLDQVPLACKDAVAILFMFDLTSRCTLHNIIGWYSEARKWNQTAIPILIGTKFDDFVQLPHDIQWSVITQARAYGKAIKATLFFSSATHNINVNKIFKLVVAKLFNLPWTVERNLNIGEPIIDY